MHEMKIARFQLVELPVAAGLTNSFQQVYFQQQPQLQSISGDKTVFIKRIEAYTRDMVPFSPFTPTNIVSSAADIANALLYISVAGDFAYFAIPLVDLVRIQGTVSANVFHGFRLKDVSKVDWTKSYVQNVLSPPTTPPFSYLFGVAYDYFPDVEDNPGMYGS